LVKEASLLRSHFFVQPLRIGQQLERLLNEGSTQRQALTRLRQLCPNSIPLTNDLT